MNFRGPIVWAGIIVAVSAATTEAQVAQLAYRPIASLYSSSLDEIIMISSNPNQLHIYNPVTQSDTAVNVPQSPMSLAISPDGNSALVGMNNQISLINLTTASTIKTSSVTIAVSSAVLGSTYAWLFSSGYNPPVAVNASTGVVISSTNYNYYYTAAGALNKAGTSLYVAGNGGMQDVDVSTGAFGAVSATGASGCGPLWLSADGTRLYTGCATILHSSSITSADLTYLRTLPVASSTIVGLSESASAGRLAVISGNVTYPAVSTLDGEVQLFTTDYFNPAGTLQLSPFVTNTGSYAAHGKALFYNSASTSLYVVEQADPSSNLIENFAVETIPVANPLACTANFSTATASVGSSGSLGSTGITAVTDCQYTALSNASWIQIVSGAFGSGNGNLAWIARPNLGSTARSGTISLGSQTLTISQSAAPAVAPALAALSYNVTDAAYSSSLDKMVTVASAPNELHIYDPVGQGDQIVPLSLPPFAISVSPDGNSAAVGHDGWVSYVNLMTAAVTMYPIASDCHHVLLAANGYIYCFPSLTYSNIYSVAISTGAVIATSGNYAGRIPRMEPNDLYFYLGDNSGSSKWDITQGGIPKSIASSYGISCADYWLSQDGALYFSGCGKVYFISDTVGQDLQQAGVLEGLTSVQWAANSALLKTTAVIPGPSSSPPNDTEIQFFGETNLSFTGTLAIPSFNIGGTNYAAHGTSSFWNGDSSKLFTIVTADATAKLASNNAIFTVTPGPTASGCTFKLEDADTVAPATGGLGSVFVSTGSACLWTFTSNQPWLTVYSDSIGVGPGLASWSAAYNTTGAARSATLTMGGQTLTINQAAAIAGTSQTIGFAALANQTLGAPAITLAATATSGLNVQFSSATPVVCSVSGEFVTILNVGSCSITASQPGNAIYNAALPVTQTFSVVDPAAGSALIITPGSPYSFTSTNAVLAMADFNGDGKLDIATSGGVLLGDGHGAFTLSTGAFPFTGYATAMAAADFNGDGVPDLVIASNNTQTLSLLLGDGAGGFSFASSFNESATSIAVADFNNDGRPDLALLYYGNVIIATNTGDGFIFSTNNSANYSAYYFAVGDFTGDGNVDVVTISSYGGTLTLLPGNGGGGFSAPSSSTISALANCSCAYTAVADFNGDGKLDIAVNTGQSIVALLNNGSGTFVAGHLLTPGTTLSAGALVVGDFNGDGKPDLAISLSTQSSSAVGIATGDGAGNFTLTAGYRLPSGYQAPPALAVGDLNGDGLLDVVAGYQGFNYSNSLFGVLLGAPSAPDLAIVSSHSGTLTPGMNGATYILTVTNVGSSASAGTVTVTDLPPFGLTPTTIAGTGWGCTPSTLTCTRSDALAAGASYPVLTVTTNVQSYAGAGGANTAIVSGGGDVNILNDTASDPTTISSIQQQTIEFGAIPTQISGSAPFTLNAPASSGLPVTFVSNTTDVCTVSGSIVTLSASLTSPSTCSLTASQAGNATYAAASPVTVTFTVDTAFTDVSSSNENPASITAIEEMLSKGITSGCQTAPFEYCPGLDVTRGQMAVFIIRSIYGSNNFSYSPTPYFTDATTASVGAFFPYIQKMHELGITSGCSTTTYCPDLTVTRGQMAVFIIRARYGTSFDFDYSSTPYFSDATTASVGAFFKYIQRMKMDNITSGCTTITYCPDLNVTRDQMAVFMIRGGFNQLLPPTAPILVGAAPATGGPGEIINVTLTGVNTNFVQGTTTVSAGTGLTVGTVTVNSPTSLTVQLTIAANATPNPASLLVTTGTEEAVLPNGFTITSDPASGAIAYWSGNGTTANSISSMSGTLISGAAYGSATSRTQGVADSEAFSLNGTSAYVQAASGETATVSGARTLVAWVYPNAGSGLGTPILTGGATSAAGDIFGITGTTGTCSAGGQYQLYVDHGGTCYVSDNSLAPNVWSLVAVAFDGAKAVFYIDDVASVAVPAAMNNNALATYEIGGNTLGGTSSGASFNGLLSEVQIYNRALSPMEIQGIYAP